MDHPKQGTNFATRIHTENSDDKNFAQKYNSACVRTSVNYLFCNGLLLNDKFLLFIERSEDEKFEIHYFIVVRGTMLCTTRLYLNFQYPTGSQHFRR